MHLAGADVARASRRARRVVVEREGRKNATAVQFVLLFSAAQRKRGKQRSVSREPAALMCVTDTTGEANSGGGCISATKAEMLTITPPSALLYCRQSLIVLDEMRRRAGAASLGHTDECLLLWTLEIHRSPVSCLRRPTARARLLGNGRATFIVHR